MRMIGRKNAIVCKKRPEVLSFLKEGSGLYTKTLTEAFCEIRKTVESAVKCGLGDISIGLVQKTKRFLQPIFLQKGIGRFSGNRFTSSKEL